MSYNSIAESCLNCFETWSSTKRFGNDLLKEMALSESISSSIPVTIVIIDYFFLDFGRICDFNLFTLFLPRFFFASEYASSYIAFECSTCSSSFSIHKSMSFCCSSSTTFCYLSISTSSTNCVLVNSAFSSIIGEVVALVIGEKCVVVVEAFLFRILTLTKIHELLTLLS